MCAGEGLIELSKYNMERRLLAATGAAAAARSGLSLQVCSFRPAVAAIGAVL